MLLQRIYFLLVRIQAIDNLIEKMAPGHHNIILWHVRIIPWHTKIVFEHAGIIPCQVKITDWRDLLFGICNSEAMS